MLYKVGHRPVFIPPAIPRTFRRQLALRVRAATNASQHASQTPSPIRPDRLVDRSLTAMMSQLMTQIGDWWTPTGNDVVDEGDILTVDELADQLQSEMQNATKTEVAAAVLKDAGKTAARPNIWKFLKPVPLEDIQNSRLMASLANVSYYLQRLQFKSFLGRYGFHLVTTSLKCKQPARDARLTDETLMCGDGMAVSETEMEEQEKELQRTATLPESNIVAAAELLETGENICLQQKTSGWTAPFNMGSAAGSFYAQTLSQLAKQLTTAASVSQSAVTDTMARVMGLVQVALRPMQTLPSKKPVTSEGQKMMGNGGGSCGGAVTVEMINKCPTEWFVCDNKKEDTRIFCIQGTHNLDSWQTNLTFDPVPFEDEALGVRVHRGIYEAAQGLYSLIVPVVRDYIDGDSKRKICFTGHSLGGAIATVLMMMLVHRGDLPVAHVGRVFTFGGAACFCDSTECGPCSHTPMCDGEDGDETCSCTSRRSLLEILGLASNTVVNVVMHKDIVPRAFACDYSLVADLLRRWSHAFRKHHCLTITGRSLLYNFIGEVYILQPHESCRYVSGEGYHPMLPQEAALYRLTEPDHETLSLKKKMMAMSENSDETIGTEVESKRDAFLALMDNPHPLDILADARAYGFQGAISRYHDPLNYSKGLRSVIRHQTKSGPRLFGWPLTPPHFSM